MEGRDSQGGKKQSSENILTISNTERGKITLRAEASSGIWVPGAGLGHLLIYNCELQQEREVIEWVISGPQGHLPSEGDIPVASRNTG